MSNDAAGKVIPFAPRASNPNRPRLSEEIEKQLDPVEDLSAVCYADMEKQAARLRKLAQTIDQSTIPLSIEDVDSAVHHIEVLRAKTVVPDGG